MSEELHLEEGAVDKTVEKNNKIVDDQYDAVEPVAPAGGKDKKRKSDKTDGEKSMSEAIESIFEGSELSEEFKEKTAVVFEAAVHERVEEVRAQISEEFEQKLEEQVSEAIDDIVEKVDSYLDYVVENYMEKNEVAIESGIKVAMAESLMSSIVEVMSEHNLELDESDLDFIGSLEQDLEIAEQKYNDVVSELIEMKAERKELHREVAFQEAVDGLTDTQASRLRTLSEGLSYDDIDEYSEKLLALKEAYFDEPRVVSTTEELDELQEDVAAEEPVYKDSLVSAYAESISRFAAKN